VPGTVRFVFFPLKIISEAEFYMKKILIEFAHPAFHKSRINKQLIAAVRNLEGVTFNDLYEHYPDFFIDVKREQNLLLSHDIIVWHHPFYWYSSPSLLIEWMDLVLEHGWAYGNYGRMLEGKSVLSAITTGGQKEVYGSKGKNHFTINEFLVPFRQSAWLCRMEYLPPFVVHGSHILRQPEIEVYADKYKKALTLLRDEKIKLRKLKKIEYLNDLID
jgi:glutathione-regulated potassium-efflux system ancillary protein KefG